MRSLSQFSKFASRRNIGLICSFSLDLWHCFDMSTLWPVATLLNYMGWEVLEWPSRGKTWAVVAINMLKTTPLLFTIGLSLTIPFAVMGDVILLNMGVGGQSLLGATLVLISFVAIGIEGSDSDESEEFVPRVETARTERVGSISVARPRVTRGRSLTKVRLSFSRPEGEDDEREAFLRSHRLLREGPTSEGSVMAGTEVEIQRSIHSTSGAS
ncbi:hypothetical protein FRC03_011715 [Tulasnella sp. 419]|nr:hypothetical protein FRC02_000313 [Tulasnella sp. 418]KAG8953588.1 hypothetical protein FRC03_011715 [Tulasnella sp. 419]